MNLLTQVYLDQRTTQFLKVVRRFGQQGWTPATSSNFSYRFSGETFVMTQSGVHKAHLRKEDLLVIDQHSNVISHDLNKGIKPSAETLIHLKIYKDFPETQCVLHTHSPKSTGFSMSQDELVISGLEMIKAYEGKKTHESLSVLKVFENSQDMGYFCESSLSHLKDLDVPAFVMRGHGIYAWGNSIAAAERHLEVTEFLIATEIYRKLSSLNL